MKLVVISGRSGSGKSTALNVLEDVGFYCIDNLPAYLLPALISEARANSSPEQEMLAVCIDARNSSRTLSEFPTLISSLPEEVETSVIYLDADNNSLIKRFSETRRKHPLSNRHTALQEAIEDERVILEPIANIADLTIDTTKLSYHELRDFIRIEVADQNSGQMTLQFQSFGFKKGSPNHADMVFDLRCLPNPHWVPSLRSQTGLDDGVKNFLSEQDEVKEMFDDIKQYLERWVPRFSANNRSYTTVAVGCTGGQHRSVFMAEKLYQHFSALYDNVQVRHRELDNK
ncbi:RNase adapter protein RapZ [Sinobacterium norvegicum]|uniref:RNase adapter protein RapZ n=1 Tax=Sinobacterium norvegicum TaxID=1641715 RepID=A0ABM9AJA3_9GAMM|nr:RNase adapter RapZ [Sinobacterium norvegicum]CAH0993329.1 RNase adapter protein RapZ [Sinobacterium norvegicum]